jgi:hypothetical protein
MNEKIISASRRTDIPAFYTPWLINRIRAGFCVYPNPLYPSKSYRVSLQKHDVLGIVFWTRHAAPLIPYLPELDKAGFAYYFQYTVVGYPRELDLRSPPLETAMKTFCELSQKIGADKVIWRYDPIILNHELTVAWHQENFRRIADGIAHATQRIVVSVVDPYAKTRRRIGTTDDGVFYKPDDYTDLLRWMVAEASARKMRVQSCAEASLNIAGLTVGGCVDASLLYPIGGRGNPVKVRLHKQREGCLCHQSIDVGVNDSCGFGCQYCYATKSHDKAMETLKSHNPDWTCITGDVHIDAPDERPRQQLLF